MSATKPKTIFQRLAALEKAVAALKPKKRKPQPQMKKDGEYLIKHFG